jgi:hypothetical protein
MIAGYTAPNRQEDRTMVKAKPRVVRKPAAARMPRTSRGDVAPRLSASDERLLDRIWAEQAKAPQRVSRRRKQERGHGTK